MTLPAFLAVWLATWALCWFGLARVWPCRRCVLGIDGVIVATVYGRASTAGRRMIEGREVHDRYGTGWRTFKPARWWRLSGAREWAPLIATVVAFAVDVLVGFTA